MAGSLSLSALREQLASLEKDREMWTQRRALESERCTWIERRQEQQARLDALADAAPPETAALPATENGLENADAAARTKLSKRQELREMTLQLLKTQQQIASKTASQLRTLRVKDASPPPAVVPSSGSSTATSRSPSPPQEASTVNGHTTGRSNKLVLVPTTTSALGKRQLGGAGAAVAPIVSYPPLTRAPQVPSESPEELASLAFRVATRHYLQTGAIMDRPALRLAIENYIGRSLREDQVYAILDDAGSAVQVVVCDTEIHSSERPSPQAAFSVTDTTVLAWLDGEKHAMKEVLSSWAELSPSAPRSAQLVAAVRAHKFTHTVHGSNPASASLTVDTLLSALVGTTRTHESLGDVETAFPHMTPVFQDAHAWLTDVVTAKKIAPTATRPTSADVGLAFNRPFDIENDSVMKQMHRSRKRRQRVDPMKVMCMYELGGACNDPNCAYQHQRDLEAANEPDEIQTHADGPRPNRDLSALQLPESAKSWMRHFVQLRESVHSRWPSLSEILSSSGRVMLQTDCATHEDATPVGMSSLRNPSSTEEADTATTMSWAMDFIELGSPLSPMDKDGRHLSAGQRYCRDDATDGDSSSALPSSSRFSVGSLEVHLKENREDVDAWLLLAVRSLELDIVCGEENVVRVTESQRLLAEVEEIHRVLQSHDTYTLAATEASIEQSLHVLSRALEIEANAYCEELWLLHLRLSQQLTTKRDVESELQMTEQALAFVRTSVSLWRHFLTLQAPTLTRLDESVTTYTALLDHIAEASKQATQQQLKESFSVLLCDVVVQLCSIQCEAGRPTDAAVFLEALLAGRPDDLEEDEQQQPLQDVRNQMIGDEVLILHLVHMHLSLFATVPPWLCERSFCEGEAVGVNVYRLLLSSDRIQQLQSSGQKLDLRSALQICEAAFETISESAFIPPGVEVLRHNWIVVYAHADHIKLPERLEQLTIFAEEELQRRTLLPRVVTLLATLFRHAYHKPDMETKLLEALMAQYKTTDSTLPMTQVYQRFGEALHHYLLNSPQLFTDDPLRTDFPTLQFMLVRLAAMLPGKKNPVYAKRAISAMLRTDVEWSTQRQSLAVVFTALVRDTLAHIVGDESDADEQDMTQDTYYLVAQVQLLSQVCGVETAMDIVDTVVIQGGASSSQWRVVPRECRRIVWSMRFGLLLEFLKQDTQQTSRARELLVQLLDRYLKDVGPRSETAHHVAKGQLANRLAGREGDGVPELGKAISLCVDYGSGACGSTLDMALFRLCLAATAPHERPSLFTAYRHHLGTYPAFWRSFAETALQESDLRRVRSGLRRLVLDRDARVFDSSLLHFLISLELQDKNVAAATHALGHRLRVNPLDSAAWELVGVLEVLFGGGDSTSTTRLTEIEAKLRETGGVLLHTRSVLGDSASSIRLPSSSSSSLAHAAFAGLRLDHVPSTLALHFSDSLCVLDLSHNQLVSLPRAICRLVKLRVLRLSGNSLVTLPTDIGQLTELQVMELAHNNLVEIPNALWDRLLALRELDLRCNALAGISPRVVHLVNLRVLRVAGNHIVWKDLAPISAKLPAACVVDLAPTNEQTDSAREDDSVRGTDASGRERMESSPRDEGSSKDVARDAHVVTVEMAAPNVVNGGSAETKSDEGPPSGSDTSGPTPSPEPVDTRSGSPTSSRTEETGDNVIALDDDEDDESKSDDPTSREAKASRTGGDVEMADATHERETSDGDDDDDIECLGSSLSTATTANAFSSSNESPPTAASELTPETLRHRVTDTLQHKTFRSRCSVCLAPNDSGTHQRLNVSVLCVACLASAVDVLRERLAQP